MQGKKIPINVATFTIGRDPKSTLQADNPAIAERHCALEVRQDKVFLRDLDSPGGTWVNDARISGETELADGDILKVGPLRFSVSIQADPKPTTSLGAAGKVKAALVIETAGPTQGRKIPLRAQPLIIGHEPGCDLTINHPTVSARQCAVEMRADKIFLRDLGGQQWTLVNGSRIMDEVQLDNGDRLEVGPLRLILLIEAVAAAPAAASPAAPAKDTPKLKVTLVVANSGPMNGQKIPINVPSFSIGRDPKCTLQGDYKTLTDRHCAIEIQDSKVTLRNLDDLSVTYVNDVQIAGPVQLKEGDRLKIGPLKFQVAIEGGATRSASPAKPPPPKKPDPVNDGSASFHAHEILKQYLKKKKDPTPEE
jgi:pSer/pThr/pTyr-binding forkhead associated (FHA) protein